MARAVLSGVDAAWLEMDRAVNTADVVAVLRLDGRLGLARLLRTLEARLLLPHPRFRQRVVRGPLHQPAWEDDRGFRLARHVTLRRLDDAPNALDAFVSRVATEPLAPDRPPWRVHLLHAGRDSAIVAKLHHCLADGFALVAVLLSLVDGAPAPRPRPARGGRDARRPAALLAAPAAALAALGRVVALPPDARTPLRAPLTGERRVACSRPIPLAAVRAASRARGVTPNELLSAALAGALRRWLREAGGADPAADVRALVPVNLRPRGDEASLGNAFGLVFLDLPVAEPSEAARVARVHERMRALKAGPEALVTHAVLGLLGRLPVAVEQAAAAFFTTKASLVLTNVPGPRRPLRLAGHRIARLMFWVPHPASLGLGVSILSYAGDVVVGVRADRAVVPEPAALVAHLEAELRALVPELWVPRRGRRLGPADALRQGQGERVAAGRPRAPRAGHPGHART